MVSRTVERAAEAVADGITVDWEEVQRRLADTPDSALAPGLRAISELAESTSGCRALPAALGPSASMSPVLLAVVVLAGAQVALGGVGTALGPPAPSQGGSLTAVAASFALTGAWLVSGARGDRRAAFLGGFFLTIAAAFSVRSALRLVDILPPGADAAFFWRGVLPEAFFPLFLWLFVGNFPRVVRFSRIDRTREWGTRAAATTGVLLFAANLLAALRNPDHPDADRWFGWLTRDGPGGAYWLALFVVALVALGVAWRRRRDAPAGERRRVAVFLGALAIGFSPSIAYVLVALLVRPFDRWTSDPAVMVWVRRVTHASLLLMPLATAHAVVAQQVLDVRWTIGRLARHLLVRSTLAALTVFPVGGLGLILYSQRASPLAEILSGPRSRALLALAIASAAALAFRRPLLKLVDRHFFHQQVQLDARLAEISSRLRTAETVDGLAGLIVNEVTATFQLADATVFARARDAQSLEPIRGRARPLANASALATLVAAASKPLLTDPLDARSVFPLLPERERHWVLDTATAAIINLREASERGRSWVLALGRKRSGQGFAPEDLQFLQTLALAAGLAFENLCLRSGDEPIRTTEADELAQVCQQCGLVVAPRSARCSCGGRLAAAALPLELSGKFRLLRLLGRGGMGVVYEAEDLTLGRKVALKTLPHLAAEHTLRLRLEARAMASLTHPNLALIHGAESWRGVPVLVLELLEGDTLARRIGQGLAVSQVTSVGLDLAAALDSMHRQGLLHRDIKPSNVGFDAQDRPKLLDFGLAHLLVGRAAPEATAARPFDPQAEATPTGHVMGTPLYLAPEAALGEPPDAGHDLWSLALVLYECLVGPEALRAVMRAFDRKRGACALPSVRDYRTDCPAAVARFLAGALSVERGHRPATAVAFAAGLREAMATPG